MHHLIKDFSKDMVHEKRIVILMNFSDDLVYPLLEKYFYQKQKIYHMQFRVYLQKKKISKQTLDQRFLCTSELS